MSLRCATFAIAALGICQSISATDPFYLGNWKIASAVIAPWAYNPKNPDRTEMNSMVGKMVVIKTTEILGPRQVACKGPKYEVKEYPADMLFQGAFGEMRSRDKSVDPAKVAAKLGFQGTAWKTLETGCGNEIDYHFIDPNASAFGLNDFVYILKKQ